MHGSTDGRWLDHGLVVHIGRAVLRGPDDDSYTLCGERIRFLYGRAETNNVTPTCLWCVTWTER